MKTKDPHQYQRDRLEELQQAVAYPLKLKQVKETGSWYLTATAKGRTVDTGSIEISRREWQPFSIFYRNDEDGGSFLLEEYERNAVLLVNVLCERLGMQPRII